MISAEQAESCARVVLPSSSLVHIILRQPCADDQVFGRAETIHINRIEYLQFHDG